ncbi:MAG TPA: hypothetical protein VKZ63_14390 [Kofleriaceae bacterium]|nr:hypothetical protein [Kofleriaceae bacterium]
MKRVHLVPVLVSLCLAPAAALAQEQGTAPPEGDGGEGPPARAGEPGAAGDDASEGNAQPGAATGQPGQATAQPASAVTAPGPDGETEPAAPPQRRKDEAPGGIVEQAGVGGEVGYGRAGVLELGGSAGFTAAADFTSANLTPSLGWFLLDNLQISGLLGVAYIEADDQDATMFSLLVEPSYHLPFGDTTFGFMGFGAGASHVEHAGLGLSFSPRVGAKFLVGRSGILTPSLSYLYTTHDTDGMSGETLMAVSSSLSANIGYTVMW